MKARGNTALLWATSNYGGAQDKTSHTITAHHHHTSLASFQNADSVKVTLIRNCHKGEVQVESLPCVVVILSVGARVPPPPSSRHNTGFVFLLLCTAD